METIKIPVWFWILAVFFLLRNIMGVLSFFSHVFISDEMLTKLPEDQSALYGDYPLWTNVVFAIAVFGGLFGSLGLILKKKWAKLAFIVSLGGIIPQMIHDLFFTKSIEVYGPGQAAIMPVMVVTFGVFLIWFSKYATHKNWLK